MYNLQLPGANPQWGTVSPPIVHSPSPSFPQFSPIATPPPAASPPPSMSETITTMFNEFARTQQLDAREQQLIQPVYVSAIQAQAVSQHHQADVARIVFAHRSVKRIQEAFSFPPFNAEANDTLSEFLSDLRSYERKKSVSLELPPPSAELVCKSKRLDLTNGTKTTETTVKKTHGGGGEKTIYQLLYLRSPEPGKTGSVYAYAKPKPEAAQRFVHEMQLLEKCKVLPFILRFDKIVLHQSGSLKGALLEFCPQKDLFEHLKANDLPEHVRKTFTVQILFGLTALHNNKIVHSDLKPENILVTQNANAEPEIRIGDFGMALSLDDPQTAHMTQAIGTITTMAPEVVAAAAAPHFSRDIWSYGIVALELLHPEGLKANLFNYLTPNQVTPQQWQEIHEEVLKKVRTPQCHILEQLLQVNPQQRPEAAAFFPVIHTFCLGV